MAKTSRSRRSPHHHVPIVASIAIVLAAGLSAWLLMLLYTAQLSKETDAPLTSLEVAEKDNFVTSLIGRVASVSDTSFIVTASPVNNSYLTRDTAVLVLFTPETAFTRASAPSSVSPSAIKDIASLYRFSPASFSDLRVGALVNVRTGTEVRGKTEVEAESIEIQEVR